VLDSGEQSGGGGQNARAGGQSGGEPAGNGQGQGAADGQTASGSSTSSSSSQSQSAEPDAGGSEGSATQEAEQTVEDFYSLAAQEDYDRSYDLLSAGWRQAQFSSQAVLEGTFSEVEDVTFVEGPTAEVSGNTATVTGTTRAELTTETQRNEGTWVLVNENGEWLIDEWTVNQISSTPA